MNHLFIINPSCCRGKAVKYAEQIKRIFEQSKEPFHIEYTTAPGEATVIARKYVSIGDYRVYSVGGDGTLNEVLNGVVNSSSSLAVIPAGSGNDFFSNLEKTIDKTILIRTIRGTEKYIDIGKVNDRYFLSIASAGLDAQIVINSNKFRKIPLFYGMSSYIAGIFCTVFKYKSFKSTVTIDDKKFKKETLLFAVANGKYYGGGMQVAPRADISDGFFDIYHVDKVSPIRIIFLFTRLIKGIHETIKEVTFFKAKSAKISSDNDFPLNIDGEAFIVREATFGIVPNGIKMVFPESLNPEKSN